MLVVSCMVVVDFRVAYEYMMDKVRDTAVKLA